MFSGIGGIELGFEKAGGFETIWFVENEPYAQAVLRKHWPNIPIYGDITKINFKKLQKPDILTGGFPCQDISNAGKRKGIQGQRSGLWKEFLRAISEIRPKYALIENVSVLRNRGLETVLCDLASIGYDAEWHCLPASAIGAPHRRDRIFIIAFLSNSWRKFRRSKCKELEKEKTRVKIGRCCKNLAYPNMPSLQGTQSRNNIKKGKQKKITRCRGASFPYAYNLNNWKQRKESLREKNRQETWATDAGILRVAHGIPNRIHRIKCIGNAVVPQCAEFFAEIIKEKEAKK